MDANQAKKIFNKAVISLQSGDYETAKKHLLKLKKSLPDSIAVSYNLALCYQSLNQLDAAIDIYKNIVKSSPQLVDVWTNLGICYLESGRIEKAEEAGKKAIEIDPKHCGTLNFLGSIAGQKNDYQQAKSLFEQTLAIDSGNKDAKTNLANLEITYLNQDAATVLIEELIAQYPEDKKPLLLKAKLLLDKKDTKAVTPIVSQLKQQLPNDDEVLRLDLSYKEAIRDDFGVADLAKKLLKTHPNDASLWCSLGNTCFEFNAIDQSKQHYEKAIKLDSTRPEYKNKLGLAYSSLGNKENAEQCYRDALATNPKYAQAYRNIVAMKKFDSVDDSDVQKLIELSNQPDLNHNQITEVSFALGKIYDDCGLYDQAFSSYDKGNNLKFQEKRLNLDSYFEHIEKIKFFFSKPSTKTNKTSPNISPIFILGMPRSGTTLVEQIIARHSEVTSCGELPCIEKIIARLEKKSQPQISYPDDFLNIDETNLTEEASYYTDWINRTRTIGTPFITDKMPFNFVHVWLIKALFPESPVIHCQRHPMDIIVSNYFQLYGVDISFVYNLETLAQYYILQHNIMQHWKALFGDKITTVVYESLVADQENQTKALISRTGLPWEDNCLNFKQSSSAVKTASIWQVRQGIYTSSKERWRNYQEHLQRPLELLTEAGITDIDGNLIIQ